MVLNMIVMNLTALIGSFLITFPLIKSKPEVLLILIVVINFFISFIVVLRIVLWCLSPSAKSVVVISSDMILLGWKVWCRYCANADACSKEIFAEEPSGFLLGVPSAGIGTVGFFSHFIAFHNLCVDVT